MIMTGVVGVDVMFICGIIVVYSICYNFSPLVPSLCLEDAIA